MKTYICTECVTWYQPEGCYLSIRDLWKPTACMVDNLFDAHWVEYTDITDAVARTHQARRESMVNP
jgi:hypothetical protein